MSLLFLLIIQTGCEHVLPTPPQPPQATLATIQANIFSARCAVPGCHVPNGLGLMSLRNTNESFTNLVSRPSAQRSNLFRVQPGNANNSYIIQKLAGASGIMGTRMPQGGPYLSSDQINLIRQWIDDGALNN
ncbi:MAG TPA: hypothetical protein VGA99_08950 [bacterium]